MFTVIKHAIPHLKSAGGGTIVTLGSEMAFVAVPESPAYNASKGAVIMFTKSIALDLIRYNIRVNALCPGITRTPLLQAEVDNSLDPAKTAGQQAAWAPIMRIADAREIAQGALFLAASSSTAASRRSETPDDPTRVARGKDLRWHVLRHDTARAHD